MRRFNEHHRPLLAGKGPLISNLSAWDQGGGTQSPSHEPRRIPGRWVGQPGNLGPVLLPSTLAKAPTPCCYDCGCYRLPAAPPPGWLSSTTQKPPILGGNTTLPPPNPSSLQQRLMALVSSGCYHRTPQTGCLKWQILFSCSSGGWEMQDQGASKFGCWWGPLPSLKMATFLLCPHRVGTDIFLFLFS